MFIFTFIPARSGSKSIKDKNVKLLGGKPLIAYSIESSLKCGLRTIVNTDSETYAEIAKQHGAETMIRSASLAQDNTSMFELLKSEIFKIDPVPDLVLLLQPTSPFRKNIHIKTAISYFLENLDKYTSLISVEKVPEKYNPAQVIVESLSGKTMANGTSISSRITKRQSFPNAWIPTGEIYIFKTSNLKKGNIYGSEVMLYESEGSININTEEDFLEATNYLENECED